MLGWQAQRCVGRPRRPTQVTLGAQPRPGRRENSPDGPGGHPMFRGPPTGGSLYSRPMKLLEREAELESLRDLWAQVPRGHGAFVLLVGEPGAGKTALAQSLVAEVGGKVGVRTLWGTCTPLATPAPLEPLRDVARQLGPPMADLVDADAPVHRVLPVLLEIGRAHV